MNLLIQLADEIRHVGRLKQLKQQFFLLERLFRFLIAGEVQERVDKMAVEVGHQFWEEVVLCGDIAAAGSGVCHDGWGRDMDVSVACSIVRFCRFWGTRRRRGVVVVVVAGGNFTMWWGWSESE